jgi:hypothetical protein
MPRLLVLKSSLAAASAALAVLTLVNREWIEVVFRVDPDRGSGVLEWLVVAVCVAASVACGAAARAEWRARPG